MSDKDWPLIPSFDDPSLRFVSWEDKPLAIAYHGAMILCVSSDKSLQLAPSSWKWSDIATNHESISREEALKLAS